ncbi:FixH family protein [Myxococcaceae bacterium GXIMD 01537]
MTRWKVALWLCAAGLPGLAGAHGGEDHGEKAPVPMAGARGPSVAATGEAFEVLVKAPEAEPGHPAELQVFVADPRTNAPLEGARVELSFLGAGEVKVAAAASGSPGIYTATTTFPSEGDWEALATVKRGSASEVLSLGPWTVEHAPEHAEEHPEGGSASKTAGLVLLGLGAVGTGMWAVRRARRGPQEVPHAR